MTDESRRQLFDEWAEAYDTSVHSQTDFPFAGYDEVLGRVVALAKPRKGLRVLDLGIGTGLLAAAFAGDGCRVTGVDFSARMIEKAKEKLPGVEFVQADLLGEWPPELCRRFERIVSAYVFHEFSLDDKVRLLSKLARHHLSCTGRMVIGDVSFPDAAERDAAHGEWGEPGPEPAPAWKASRWDEDEHYWVADDAMRALSGVGLRTSYRQVSFCGGVYVVEPVDRAKPGAREGAHIP